MSGGDDSLLSPTCISAKKDQNSLMVLDTAQDDDDEDLPAPTKWQEMLQNRLDMDVSSGVAWHPSTVEEPTAKKSIAESRLAEVRMEVASWFLTSDNKYVKVDDPETRLGEGDITKLVPQMMTAHYTDTAFEAIVEKKAGAVVEACLFAAPSDPRLTFGIWSGKAYPAPGNPSRRLYRNHLWDINSWALPAYRKQWEKPEYGASMPFLEFAIPEASERTMLLDWIAWSLQNEALKPHWAVLLFSQEKGTGKSTIGVVLEALFGASNTAKIDGVSKLVASHNDRVLDKKLIVAEEVHISSHSDTGNALKDLITSDRTTVNPKYLPMKTIPLKACYLFTTNHKPLWLEGGERRYFIIKMQHDGHAQGPNSEVFSDLVGDVMEQIKDEDLLAALYGALMARQISSNFDPKNMRFSQNATPIMRELQAQSGNEADETLEALLAEYSVSIIPSSDFKALAKYLNVRNDNSLRNSLVRLGWESMRLYLGAKQQRVWAKKGLLVESGRIFSSELSESLAGAVENGYEWHPFAHFIAVTWKALMKNKLARNSGKESDGQSDGELDADDSGPFLDSSTHRSYRTWYNDNLLTERHGEALEYVKK